MAKFSPDYIAGMRETLSNFYGEAANYTKDQGLGPAPRSQAATEQATFPRSESLVTAQSLANQLIESGGEHLTAFVKTITEPTEPIACWTCVRSLLEPCALAAWLLEPGIDARTRVGRVFALRYEGLDQRVKFGWAVGRHKNELKELQDRINDVEQIALKLGYLPIKDRKGKRIGIAQQMPGTTEVIKEMLDEEAMYRLLSAVAHGHSWAIIQLGFKPIADEAGGLQIGGVKARGLEKNAFVDGIAYLGLLAAKVLARPLWYRCRYFGWDEARLIGLLEGVFDRLQAKPEVRFWRVPPRSAAAARPE